MFTYFVIKNLCNHRTKFKSNGGQNNDDYMCSKNICFLSLVDEEWKQKSCYQDRHLPQYYPTQKGCRIKTRLRLPFLLQC